MSFVILIVWVLGLFVADEFIVSVHAKFLGFAHGDLLRLGCNAKLICYQFLSYFKLGAALLFFYPLVGSSTFAESRLRRGQLGQALRQGERWSIILDTEIIF